MKFMRIVFMVFALLGLFGINNTSLAVNWIILARMLKEYPDGASDIFLVAMARRAKIIKYFSYAVYDKNGVITSAGDFYDGWKHIVPESGMEAVYKAIWPFN